MCKRVTWQITAQGLPGRENASRNKCAKALHIREVFVNLDLASRGFQVAQEGAGNREDSFQGQSDSCTFTVLVERVWSLTLMQDSSICTYIYR